MIFIISLTTLVVPFIFGLHPTLSINGINSNYSYINLISNSMLYLFLSGVMMAKVAKYSYYVNLYIKCVALLLSILQLVLLIQLPEYSSHGILSSGIPLFTLFFAFVLNEDLFQTYKSKIINFLGDVSFSLYLIHTLMNVAFDKRFDDLGLENGWIKFAIYSLISLFLAALSYKYLESKVISRKRIHSKNVEA